MNANTTEAQYKALQLEGTSSLTPRLGSYKIISTNVTDLLSRFGRIAIANWRPPNQSDYDESFQVEFSLEILIDNASTHEHYVLLKSVNSAGMEVHINLAYYNHVDRRFQVEYEITNPPASDLKALKEQMKNIDELLDDLDFTTPDDFDEAG